MSELGDRVHQAREQLSFARTALDDPNGLDEREEERAREHTAGPDRFLDEEVLKLYAIDRIDEAMSILEVLDPDA